MGRGAAEARRHAGIAAEAQRRGGRDSAARDVSLMSPDVIVIGGGFAGLRAATALAAAGARVVVLEARGQLGGRATAFFDRASGEWVDNGQHVLMGCYDETFDFLRTIGAASNVRLQPALEVAVVDDAQQVSTLRCPPWRPPFNLLAGVLGWRAVPFVDRLKVLGLAPVLGSLRGAGRSDSARSQTPDQSVEAWLQRHRQAPSLQHLLWEPLALAALNEDVRKASARPFVEVLRRMVRGSATSASLGIPTRPLHQAYAEPARRFIEAHGGRVRLNTLARVVVESDRLSHVEVRGERLQAGAVVSAVPWFALPSLVAGTTSALRSIVANAGGMIASPIVSVNVWLDRDVLPCPFVGLPGRSMQWAFDKRWAFGDSASYVTLVASGAGDIVRSPAGQVADRAIQELRDAFPAMRKATVHRTLVVREPQATFSVAPGQPPRPPTLTPVHNLVLAGDWVETGLPSTIESACLSGRLAAEALLR